MYRAWIAGTGAASRRLPISNKVGILSAIRLFNHLHFSLNCGKRARLACQQGLHLDTRSRAFFGIRVYRCARFSSQPKTVAYTPQPRGCLGMVNFRSGRLCVFVLHAHSRCKNLIWNNKTRRRRLQFEKYFAAVRTMRHLIYRRKSGCALLLGRIISTTSPRLQGPFTTFLKRRFRNRALADACARSLAPERPSDVKDGMPRCLFMPARRAVQLAPRRPDGV